MTSCLAPHLNDDSIQEILSVLKIVCSTHEPPVRFRAKMNAAVDHLHELCERMERDGLAEDDEERYLILFDALSFFTDAIRWPGVRIGLLRDARDRLESLGDLPSYKRES
jgi:hypothetical protein